MTRKIVLLTFAVLALSLTACTDEENEIKRTAQGYLKATGNYEIDKAIPFASKHTRENTIPVFNNLMRFVDTNYVKANTPAEFTIKKIDKKSDSIAVVHYHKHTPIKELDDSISLILEDGKWLVEDRLAPIPFFPKTTKKE